MFEIFGALLGGAYLLHKTSQDKYNHKMFQRRLDSAERIRSMVSSWDYESQLRSKFFYTLSPDIENGTIKLTEELHEKIWNDVIETRKNVMYNIIPESDMIYIFGETWKEWFDSLDIDYNSLKDTHRFQMDGAFGSVWELIFNVWLSMHGYIGTEHTYHGYQFMHGMVGILHENREGIATRACEIIERNINNKHPNIDGLKLYVGSVHKMNLLWKYESEEFISHRIW